jgi:tryptophan synthase alpha chain
MMRINKEIVPYIMVGDPCLDYSYEQFDNFVKLGIKTIEIGLPFSDPSADGKTIQEAGKRALDNGTTIRTVVEFMENCKNKVPEIQLVLMSYYNPILQYGIENLNSTIIDACVIPDLPVDDYREFTDLSTIPLVPLLTTITSHERIKYVCNNTEGGFIYLMAVKGITGTKSADFNSLETTIKMIRQHTSRPIVAGFGIKTKDQVNTFLESVDGVIIASQIIKYYTDEKYNEIERLLN